MAFLASSLNSTPRALASTPARKPCTLAQPVTRLVPYSGLYSPNRDPSTTRASTSRGSNGTRKSADAMPSRSSGSCCGGSAGPAGPGPSLRQFSSDTICRPIRMQSSSSAAK